jgi:N-acetylneuraminic acid mutarotase
MGAQTSSKASRSIAVGPAARQALSQAGRCVVEQVEGRTLMCSVPGGPQLQGSTVPWLASPLVAASVPVAEPVADNTAATPVVGAQPRVLSPVSGTPLRINAGGAAFTDSLGRTWQADDGFVGGGTSTTAYAVANTTDDTLYFNRRFGGFNYNIPVSTPGTYTLRLHFADPLYTSPGKRKFAVRAEGNLLLNYFDVAAAGGGKRALVRSFSVNVNDGTLNLAFLRQVENPILSAIEVVPPTSTGVGSVASLSLVNANTDADIGNFTNGAVLDISGGKTYSVRANTSGTVRSVQFRLNGVAIRTESSAPYAVAGDNAGDYAPWNLTAGTYTLQVVPYSGTGATGTAGTPVSVNFTVTGENTNPTPAFTTINWVTRASSPIVRAEALTAKWNDRLYVFGGFSGTLGPVTTSHYYSPATNTWTPIKDLPQRMTHVGMAQTDTDVYFVGSYYGLPDKTGYGQIYGSNKVWRYNFATDTYTAMPNLPRNLASGGAAIINNKLHYFGGQEADRTDTKVHLVLDLNNPSAGWKSARAIPTGRSHMGSVAFGGKIYAIAGQIGNDAGLTTLRAVEVYDPATDTWTTKNPIPRGVSHIASATFVMGDRIIVMGGESAHNAQLRDVWAYTPATDQWQALSPLPAAKFSGVANHIGGKIVFTTGGSGSTTWVGTPA